MNESELTKKVSNDTVETYYYVLFWIVAVLAGLVILMELYVLAVSPKRGLVLILRSAPTLILAVANAFFLYILSARALK
jgi:lipid-A-disaccharide synthase-like uncharacterized protein